VCFLESRIAVLSETEMSPFEKSRLGRSALPVFWTLMGNRF